MARRPLLPNCIIPDRIVAFLTHTNILKIFDIDRRGGAIRDVLEYRYFGDRRIIIEVSLS